MKSHRIKATKLIIWLLYAVCLIIGFFGFSGYYKSIGESVGVLTKLYNSLQLFVFESPVTGDVPILLDIARFLAPVLLAGTILDFFFYSIQSRLNLFLISNKFKNHIVFIGFNSISRLLIQDYVREGKYQILIIEKTTDEFLNQSLKGKRVRTLVMNPEDPALVHKANIGLASTVFIIMGSDMANMRIMREIATFCENQNLNRRLRLILHISDHFNMRVFKEFQEKKIRNLDFHAFDIYQKFASIAVYRYSPDQYMEFNESSHKPCHILIHGINPITEHLICESANLYHFADLRKIKITVIDEDVEEKIKSLLSIHPFIQGVVEFRPVDALQIYDPLIQESLADIVLCFVCNENEGKNYYTAQRYRQIFTMMKIIDDPDRTLGKAVAPLNLPRIVVLSPDNMDLFKLFENFSATADFIAIERFILNTDICNKPIIADDKETTDNLAMQLHNIHRGLVQSELIKEWDNLTEREKDFNRYSVRHLSIKLRYLKLKIVPVDDSGASVDLGSLPENQRALIAKMEHNRWVAEKLIYGYQPFAEIPDRVLQGNLKARLLLHKDIRPWEELSDKEQEKDSMIIDNIRKVIHATGNKLIRI